mgnify:CR=1 FL=1
MNKIYDKLLLFLALLLLGGGVYLYLQKTGEAPSMSASSEAPTGTAAYEPEVVPETTSTEANWPEVPVQSTGWRYDVFTPPKIFIDENGQFTEEGWQPTAPPPPFGIYLAAIERQLYRIQFEGYIEEDRSDPSKTLLLLHDQESDRQIRVRLGQTAADFELEVVDFDIQRVRDVDNNIEVIAKATILDQRSGEELVLTHGELLYESGLTVRIASNLDPSFEKEFTQAPAEFEGPGGKYTLLEIDVEDASVRVEKHAVEDVSEAETRSLEVQSASGRSPTRPAANDASSNSTAPSNTDSPFDFNF